MTEASMIWAFNEWMRRYIDEPERYEREISSVAEFLREESDGAEPSYGAACTAYMRELVREAP